MRQSFTPNEYVPPARANAADAVFDNAAQRPDHVAFLRPVGDQWRAVTAARFADEVTRLAAGLIANDVRPGDRVALMGGTSYEWMRCDFAIWAAGGWPCCGSTWPRPSGSRIATAARSTTSS